MMLYNMCRKCQKPIKYPERYCDNCKVDAKEYRQESERLANRRYNQTRNKKYMRFYKSNEWRRLSAAYMQDRSYMCEFRGKRCTTLATEVHHVDPIQSKTGWDKRLDWDNLMCVCVECHNEIHKRFGGKR